MEIEARQLAAVSAVLAVEESFAVSKVPWWLAICSSSIMHSLSP